MPHITAARALTAHLARRFVRLATVVALSIFLAILVLCALLSYFFSGWWWLLLIPFTFLFVVFLVLRLVLRFIVGKIHTQDLSRAQRQALDEFTDKLERLVEARGTPPFLFVLITIKDLLLHRDITTIRSVISDTTTLRRDYATIERLF